MEENKMIQEIAEENGMQIIIEEINEEYYSAGSALEERGYIETDYSDYPHIKELFIDIYKKDEKYYGLLEFEHFNKLIYDATLVEAESLEELDDFVKKKEVDELETGLVGEILTLSELDSEVCTIIEIDCDGPSDYDIETIFGHNKKGKIGDEGSFCWHNYNVCFTVVEEPELDEDDIDIEDIVVRVDSVEIIDA